MSTHEPFAISSAAEYDVSAEETFVAQLLLETGVRLSQMQHGDILNMTQPRADEPTSFVELGTEKIHGYCEICVRMLQMYQRGLPDVCSGLTDTFFISCVKNLESILKADRAVVYWHQVGCIHMDDGPEIVKPCPAHTICGWIPNIFARRTGITQQIGQLAPLCPRDVNYLPRVPRTIAPGGLPGQ